MQPQTLNTLRYLRLLMVSESSFRNKGIKISDAETIQKFEAIKQQLGLKNDVEVLRYLVNRFYKFLVEKKGYIDADSDAEVI